METKILCLLLLLTAAGVSLGAPAGSPEPSATEKADATKDALADGAAGYRPDVHAADAGGDESSKAAVADGTAGSRPAVTHAAAGGPETTAVGRVVEFFHIFVAATATPFLWASKQIGSLFGGFW